MSASTGWLIHENRAMTVPIPILPKGDPMKTPTKAHAPAPEPVRSQISPLSDPDVQRLGIALRDGLFTVAFGIDLAKARETVAASIFAAKG
jgi:hypothetical protein